MNRGRFILRVVLAGTFITVFAACKSERPKSKKQMPETPHPTVVQLASKYEAVSDWRKTLGEMSFTVEVERALIEDPGERPIVIVEEVQDVLRRNGDFWLRLSPLFSFHLPPVDFELRCPEDVLEPVFKNRDYFAKFAVVAKIRKVRKVVLEVNASAVGEGEVELELGPPLAGFARYLATGECLDVAYIGERANAGPPTAPKER